MRYELIRFAQLVFALAVMIGAFMTGLAIGWLRWGRSTDEAIEPATDLDDVPRLVKPDLFSPAVVPAVVQVAGRLGAGVATSLQRWTDEPDAVDAELVPQETTVRSLT